MFVTLAYPRITYTLNSRKLGISQKSQDGDGAEIVRFHNALAGGARETIPEENAESAVENANTPRWQQTKGEVEVINISANNHLCV